MSPNQIAHFEVLRELGSSSRDTVFKALDSNGKPVVLRIFRPGSAPSTFLETARRALALDSSNIVRVHEVADTENGSYVATEYAEGNTLRSLLAQNAGISIWDITDIARQVCAAIDHAHSCHLAHQKLTPGNIMVEWDGTVKLMDYGLPPAPEVQTGSGGEALHYLSPEQTRGESPDRCSNLFSLGSILYEMATGRKAFAGSDAKTVLEKIASAAPDAPCKINDKVEPGLSRVVMQAISKSPGERYQSGDELIRALESCRKAGASPLAVPPATVAFPQAPMAGSPERHEEVVFTFPGDSSYEQMEMVAPWEPPSSAGKPAPNAPAAVELCSAPRRIQSSAGAPAILRIPSLESPLKQRAPKAEAVSAPAVVPAALPASIKPTPVAAAPATPKPKQLIAPPAMVKPKPLPATVRRKELSARERQLLACTAVGLLLLAVAAVAGGVHFYRQLGRAPISEQVTQQEPAQTGHDEVLALATPEDSPSSAKPSRTRKRKPVAPLPVAGLKMTGELVIDSSPQGATIQLDGDGASRSATPYYANAMGLGKHTIVFSKPGYATETRTVEVTAGLKSSVTVTLKELGATLSISSDPAGAAVIVDGTDTGKTTPVSVLLPKGSHAVTLRKTGFLQADTTLSLAPGQTAQFSPRLLPMGKTEEVKTVGKISHLFGRGIPSGMGKLQIKTHPKGAQISINQRALNKVTPAELEMPAGSYEITLTLNGHSTVQRTITVAAGSSSAIEETLEK